MSRQTRAQHYAEMSEDERKRVYRLYLSERRNNKKYWGKRAAEKVRFFNEEADKIVAELSQAYTEAELTFKEAVANVFAGFSGGFGLSQAKAKELIKSAGNKAPSKALIQMANRITDPNKRQEALAVLSAPAYKWRVDRLDKLTLQAEKLCEGLNAFQLKADTAFLSEQMIKAYNYTFFDMQQGGGLIGAFNMLPESRIEQVLKTKWLDKHFSTRIWDNTHDLADELRQALLNSFMTGESSQKAVGRIAERFQTGRYEAERLIRTEHTYVCGQAELESYKSANITHYEYAALIDDRTSLICEGLDNKIFPVAKAKPGVNYPPMHAFCRSSTIAVLPSEEELEKSWKQFNAEFVPQGMSFEEWVDKLEPTKDGKLVFKAA